MADSSERHVDDEELRKLGFPESLIEEALERERRGLLDVWPRPEPKPGPANDTVSKAPLGYIGPKIGAKIDDEIGAIEIDGNHKGEIYGGIFPDGKAGWISEETNPMRHYDAVKLKGRTLPTSEEGKYIDTIKGKGDLKDIFARHSDGSSTAGDFWLAEHNYYRARYQQFSDGHQGDDTSRYDELPVLCVRR